MAETKKELKDMSIDELVRYFRSYIGKDFKDRVGAFEEFHHPDHEIDERNLRFAEKNIYEFTDTHRAFKKKAGVTRIAVIGDSFIWGDGIP